MFKLSEPSRELAARIIGEVDFEDRFFAGRYRENLGVIKETAYSFKKIIDILNDPIPLIDLNLLEKWIRDVMGDNELSAKISSVLDELNIYRQRVYRIKVLMEERLVQCEKIM